MSDFELFIATVRHCGPWFAAWIGGTWLLWRAYQRNEFRKYEQRRRRYTEWRLSHLDEIQ